MVMLLVEDDMFKSKITLRLLALQGIQPPQVLLTDNLMFAQRIFRERDVSRVITDWKFPLMEGGTPVEGAGAQVVEEALRRGIPIGVFSGSAPPETMAARWWTGDPREAVKLALGMR